MEFTRSALDKLGDRLKTGTLRDDDLDAFEAYRASVYPAVTRLTEALDRAIENASDHGSRVKTLESTVAKLRRGTTKLSQMQDIGGVRYRVEDLVEQEKAINSVRASLAVVRMSDYRAVPDRHYRAVHLIVSDHESGRVVEVQIRTAFQDAWANLSESYAAAHGIEVKYGGGPAWVQQRLAAKSRVAFQFDAWLREVTEPWLVAVELATRQLPPHPLVAAIKADARDLAERLARARSSLLERAAELDEVDLLD